MFRRIFQEKTPVDILCLTETFIKSGDETNINIKDFNVSSYFSRKTEKRGGVCILTRKLLTCTPSKLCENISTEKLFECCGVEIPVIKCIIIICLYRIPNADLSIFFDKLELILDKICKKNFKKIILNGDLNIDTLKTNNASETLKNILLNYYLQLHLNQPTRQQSCIDHVISNINEATSKVHQLFLSDHDTAQTLTFPVNKLQPRKMHWFVMKRDLSRENLRKFKDCLSSLSWSSIYAITDCNQAFNLFHENLLLFYSLCFPLNKIKISSNIQPLNGLLKE